MDLSDASEKFPSDTTGIDPGTFRLVAQRLNHYATPGPLLLYYLLYSTYLSLVAREVQGGVIVPPWDFDV